MSILKKYVDAVANVVKAVEELDPNAVILPNIERSLQLDWYSCGAQSVFVILRYYRRRCTIEGVTRQLHTDWDGTALEDIQRVFRKYGLRYRVNARAKLSDLRRAINAGNPVLISTGDGSHWTVVYGYSPTHVFVCDPSLTENVWCRVFRDEFMSQWDEWMLIVK